VKAWFLSDGVMTKWLPDKPVNENAPLASVTVLLDWSQERKTWTPARADPPDVIVPLNEMLVAGGWGPAGLPPLHAARHPKAAVAAIKKTKSFVFIVGLPFAIRLLALS
jgi:hypothetical protein